MEDQYIIYVMHVCMYFLVAIGFNHSLEFALLVVVFLAIGFLFQASYSTEAS